MLTKKRRKKSNNESFLKRREDKKDLIEFCDEEGDNLLHLAVVANIDSQTMKNICNFLSKNCRHFGINCRNNLFQTPLHIASCIGNKGLVKVLIDFGADIGSIDRNIENSIHLAVKYGNKSCLEILVSNCKDRQILNALNINGFSALHLCVDCQLECAPDMARLLCSGGADINVRDGLSGRTPLMHALMSNRKENNLMKSILIALNADISQSDYSGFKPIDVLQQDDI